MKRRLFTCLGISALAALLVGCSKPESKATSSETLQSKAPETIEWKMVTSWPKKLSRTGHGTGAVG